MSTFELPPTGVAHVIIDLSCPARHKRAKQCGASLEHCHGAFLAEGRKVLVCAGAAGLTHAPARCCHGACALAGRSDGLQDARRLEWIASAALAGRRPERVAVTGLLSSGSSLRSSDRSDQDFHQVSLLTMQNARCKLYLSSDWSSKDLQTSSASGRRAMGLSAQSAPLVANCQNRNFLV